MPSRKRQGIIESPRMTNTEYVGLSGGSLDGVKLGRFVSKDRARLLTILGKLRTSAPPRRRAW